MVLQSQNPSPSCCSWQQVKLWPRRSRGQSSKRVHQVFIEGERVRSFPGQLEEILLVTKEGVCPEAWGQQLCLVYLYTPPLLIRTVPWQVHRRCLMKTSCIYWDDHMIFILQFVNVVYHSDWFADIEKSLHPWDKSCLIMVYDTFNVLLDLVC